MLASPEYVAITTYFVPCGSTPAGSVHVASLLPSVSPIMLDPPLHVRDNGVGGVLGGEPDGGGVAKKNVRSPVGTTANFGTVTDAVIWRASETDGGLGDDEMCVCVVVACTVCAEMPAEVAKSSSPE